MNSLIKKVKVYRLFFFLIILVALCLSTPLALAQRLDFMNNSPINTQCETYYTKTKTLWSKIYNTSNEDIGKSIIKVLSGSYAITGWTNSSGAGDMDVFIMSLTSNGTQLWNYTFGGVEEDKGFQVINSKYGGFLVISTFTNTSALVTNTDIMITRVALNGTILWNKYYSGPEQDDVTKWIGDLGRSIVECPNGDIVFAGVTITTIGNCDIWLSRLTPFGSKIWDRTYHHWDIDRCYTPHALVQCSDGGFAIASYTYNNTQSNDVWLIRTNSLGIASWNKTYGDSAGYQRPEALIQCADNGFAIAANTQSFGAGLGDAWIIRTDSIGNQLWNKTFGGQDEDGCSYIVGKSDSGFIIAAGTHSFDIGNGDGWLIRLNGTGQLIWNHTFGDSFGNSFACCVHDGNDTYTCLGSTFTIGNPYNKIWMIKVQIVTYLNTTTPITTTSNVSITIILIPFVLKLITIIKKRRGKRAI